MREIAGNPLEHGMLQRDRKRWARMRHIDHKKFRDWATVGASPTDAAKPLFRGGRSTTIMRNSFEDCIVYSLQNSGKPGVLRISDLHASMERRVITIARMQKSKIG